MSDVPRFNSPKPTDRLVRKAVVKPPEAPKPLEPIEEAPVKKKKDNRLPDLSRFEFNYNASKQTWKGTLKIVHPEGGVLLFEDEWRAVITMFVRLDSKYRKWLRQHGYTQEGKKKTKPEEKK